MMNEDAIKILAAKLGLIEGVLEMTGIADFSILSNKDYLDLFNAFEEDNADKAYEIVSKCFIGEEMDGDKNEHRFN